MVHNIKKHIDYPDLEPLFRPKSIAIIGASDDITKPSGLPLKYALDHGYKGKLFPVNPKRETVQGLKAYPSIGAIPEEVDACVIVIPAEAVVQAIKECADKRVKAVIIAVSGFAELNEEGKKRQDEIEAIAQKSGMRICGPNTNGLLNVHEGISLGYSFAQEVVFPGNLGYVSQSGALLSATAPRFANRGVGMSYFVGAGNQANLEVFDYVRYLIDTPNTDVIAVYVEGFKNPEKFNDVADLALDRGKPIIMLKVGRSELAAKAAKSHTGSLVGSDVVIDAICKQKGISRANDFDELIAISSVFTKCKLPKGNRVGVISSSGGAIALTADQAGSTIIFSDVSAKTKEEALKVLPWYGELRSPFDIASAGARATAQPELAQAAVNFVLNDENVDILLAVITPMDRRGTENYIRAVIEASKTAQKPIILFSPMAGLREGEAKIFTEGNIPMLTDGAECVKALDSLVSYSRALERHRQAKSIPEAKISVNIEEIKNKLKTSSKSLSEHESKELLQWYGIPVTKEMAATSSKEAAKIADKISYPVALKIDSPDILHKTEAGAIKLGLRDSKEVAKAYNEVIANSKKYNPNARIKGVLVQEMITDAREVIIGMSIDPQFGPTIMFGLGGVFVEVLKDVSFRVPPLHQSDAEDMIKEVKGYKILESFRGKPEADIKAIIDVLLNMSQMALDLGDTIAEIDINPLMVMNKGKGAKAADALVLLR